MIYPEMVNEGKGGSCFRRSFCSCILQRRWMCAEQFRMNPFLFAIVSQDLRGTWRNLGFALYYHGRASALLLVSANFCEEIQRTRFLGVAHGTLPFGTLPCGTFAQPNSDFCHFKPEPNRFARHAQAMCRSNAKPSLRSLWRISTPLSDGMTWSRLDFCKTCRLSCITT